MTTVEVPHASYAVVSNQGAMPEAVVQAWRYIWSPEFSYTRAYTTDVEVYHIDKPQNVDIYIAIEKERK
jgi:predicted transcriptional regulator YdeE